MTAAVRVLIADDSAFVRKVLRRILERAGHEVVDVARDGLEALEKIERFAPDVVTLDLMMPHLDGLGVLEALRGHPRPPRVVVVSISGSDTDAGMEALARGAVSLVEKPTALATERMYELEGAFIEAVAEAAVARVVGPPAPLPGPIEVPIAAARTDVIVMGASTGGPQALTHVLTSLPRGLPIPVAVVLHIPPGYTAAFARRVDAQSPLTVVEAREGLVVRPGMAVIARAGIHLRLERGAEGAIARLDVEPVATPHRPSVDVLFQSASYAYGSRVLGVVLTGMGDDGTLGARDVRARGGRVLTEAESSCVVYGMPRAVKEAGLSTAEAPLSQVPLAILRAL